DAWHAEIGDEAEHPRWAKLLSAKGDSYLCVPPDPGIEAAALGASESALPGTAPAEALHTFTLDLGASRCFFRDSTTLTPLSAPVPVRLADPSGGAVIARSPIVGHPSLPRLHGMHSCLLVSSLPRSLPPLPPSPALPCLPCVEGRQRAALHSSLFPSTTAPLQTLHMDVWGPARGSGQGRERYFLLVVDDYTRYTTVFPLCSNNEVPGVLIPWIRAVGLQLHERFRQDLPVLRLHYDRGGEFSSDLLRDICRGDGILQSFTLPASPQRNGIAERRIGLVMELNLWPRVSLPETSPTLRWTGKVGDALVFESGVLMPLFAIRLRTSSLPALFPASSLAFPLTCLAGSFTTPPHAVSSPIRTSCLMSEFPFTVDPLPGSVPIEVAEDSGAARGAASGGAEPACAEPGGAEPAGAESDGAGSGGAEPRGAEPGGTEPAGAEPWGAESEGEEPGGAESGGAEPEVSLSPGGPPGALSRREPLSPPQLREWFSRRTCLQSGATGARGSVAGGSVATGAGGAAGAGAGGTGARAAGVSGAASPGGAPTGGSGVARAGDAAGVGARGTRAGAARVPGAAGPGGARTGVTGAARAGDAAIVGVGDTGAGRAGPGGAGAVGARSGDTRRPRQYFVPLLQQVLGLPSSTALTSPLLCAPPDQSQPPLQPASPLPAPSPYTEQAAGLTKRREPVSHPASPVCAVRTGRCVPRLHPPPVPGTHHMAIPRAASPTVPRLLASVISDPSFKSTTACALVTELVDFAAACRLDYATAIVAESESACPPSVGGECALRTDDLEDRQEDFECLAPAIPSLVAMLLAPEGDPHAPDIPTPRSYVEAITGSYVHADPPFGANIVDGMWIFMVKRPPGSPPAFKARYVARGFSQGQGADFFKTFSPTTKMTTLRVLLHVAAQRDYELHSLDFNTAFLQGSLHKEIWLRHPPGFTGTTLAALGFAPSTADSSLFLRIDTLLPPFYVFVYVDDLVFATADTEALALVKSELQKRYTCTNLGPSALRLPVLLATVHSSTYRSYCLP
ncbi:unnamed protein product, partial [Closterium sp. NIES-53]